MQIDYYFAFGDSESGSFEEPGKDDCLFGKVGEVGLGEFGIGDERSLGQVRDFG